MTDFTFEGFEPSAEIKSQAKQMLWSLENRAPSQARPEATLRQVGDNEYIGAITFTAPKITLSAEISETDPQKVLDGLNFKLTVDIETWKESRDLSKSL